MREAKNRDAIAQTLMAEFNVPMSHAIINLLDGMMEQLKN